MPATRVKAANPITRTAVTGNLVVHVADEADLPLFGEEL